MIDLSLRTPELSPDPIEVLSALNRSSVISAKCGGILRIFSPPSVSHSETMRPLPPVAPTDPETENAPAFLLAVYFLPLKFYKTLCKKFF